MVGSMVYGFFLGVGAVVLLTAAPQPAGSIVWWGIVAAQLAWAAALCWRRTALPFATAAMATGAAVSGLLAVLAAAGHGYPDLPRASWVVVGPGMVSMPAFLLIESRVNRAKWQQWRAYMQRKNAWEIFTGRHIPDLRAPGADLTTSGR